MPRKSDTERRREQRARQQQLRDKHREEKRPDRDDIARTALFWLISRAIEKGQHQELEKVQEHIVRLMVEQGFDERASYDVFDALLDKYRSGISPFRRKLHLLQNEVDGNVDA